jgi:hypothetical protein
MSTQSFHEQFNLADQENNIVSLHKATSLIIIIYICPLRL